MCCLPKIEMERLDSAGLARCKISQMCTSCSRPSFALDPVKSNGFVNPQITDFLTINWNKVINWYDLVTCSQDKKKQTTKRQCRTPTQLRGQCCTAAESKGGSDEEARWGDRRRCIGLWGAALESQMKKKTTLKRESERDAASIRLSAQAYLIKYAMPFEVVEYSWSTEKQG